MRNAVLTISSGVALLPLLVWWLWPDTRSTDGAGETPPPTAAPTAAAPARPTAPPSSPPPPTPSVEPAAVTGSSDEQRRVQEIQALVREGRVGHARALTDRFYRDYPESPAIPALERLTGYHPRPYGP